MKLIYLKNFRKGLATNSSSTHSIIYRNKEELFKDLNVFELDYYDRHDSTIAASREAKIKYLTANIMWEDDLLRTFTDHYPEARQYLPLIEKSMQDRDSDIFGMTCRGQLYDESSVMFSMEYLMNIVEDDEIVIVGGSDEANFIYDTIEGHDNVPKPDIYDERYSSFGLHKNGNYWFSYGHTYDRVYVHDRNEKDGNDECVRNCCNGKLRFMTEKGETVPEMPELIDLRITNQCNHGCKFCFMDSNMEQKHADYNFLNLLIANLQSHCVEFSIGGGNILLYPQLEDLLANMKTHGHVVNVTINVKDCKTIMESEKFTSIFTNFVDGVGVSAFEPEDVDTIVKFRQHFMECIERRYGNFSHKRHKYIVMHLIPEYLGYGKTKEIIKKTEDVYMPMLFLGYKENGRGKNVACHAFTDEELSDMCQGYHVLNVDTTFANRYKDWLMKNYTCDFTMTLKEGEYSMYIDGVEQKAYKSSYQLEKPYNMSASIDYTKERRYFTKDAFMAIRKDNGLKVYGEDDAQLF